MQIPRDILQCVCFVEVMQDGRWSLNGTAFLIDKPLDGVHPAVDADPRVVYVVTAKHVLHHDGKSVDDDPWWYDDARLKLSANCGGVGYVPVPPGAWTPHPYSDTAVARVEIDHREFDYRCYPADTYVNRDFFTNHHLTPGEEVVVMGLLWAHPGLPQIMPIVRVGHVASFPLDKVNLDTGPEEAILIEVLSNRWFERVPSFPPPRRL